MPFIESPEEFMRRHGGDPRRRDHGAALIGLREWIFPDGARIIHDGLRPRCYEPPADPVARLEARTQYHETKLAYVVDQFRLLKHALQGRTDRYGQPATYTWDVGEFGPPPEPVRDGAAALRRLKEIATEHRQAIAQIAHEADALPGAIAERKRARADRKIEEELAEQEAERWAEIAAIDLEND